MPQSEILYYLKKLPSLSNDNEKEALLALSKISEAILSVHTAIFTSMVKRTHTRNTEATQIQKCMVQYMAYKHLTVHNITLSTNILTINGVKYEGKDYTPATSIVRSMYELLLVHHSLFYKTKDEEKQFLIERWKYQGLAFLADKISPFIDQSKIAKRERMRLLESIKNSHLYIKNAESNGLAYFMDDNGKRKLKLCNISEGFEMLKASGEFSSQFVKSMYSRLCSETHPSYYALIVFENQSQMTPSNRIMSLYLSCALMCYMLNEIITQSKELNEVVNSLDEMQQSIFRSFIHVL